MENELLPLALLLLLQMIMVAAATAVINKFTGMPWLLSSRGEPKDFAGTIGGRMDRARNNGFEAIIVFAPTVFILVALGASTAGTINAAWIFLVARVVYWICYTADLTPWRTLVWMVGWAANLWMILVAVMAMV